MFCKHIFTICDIPGAEKHFAVRWHIWHPRQCDRQETGILQLNSTFDVLRYMISKKLEYLIFMQSKVKMLQTWF